MNRKRSNLEVMMRLIGLVKPLTGYMILAICMGLIGHLRSVSYCACRIRDSSYNRSL